MMSFCVDNDEFESAYGLKQSLDAYIVYILGKLLEWNLCYQCPREIVVVS